MPMDYHRDTVRKGKKHRQVTTVFSFSIRYFCIFLPDGASFALSLTSPSQPGGQLMRAKEGISYPLKGFALILQVSIWSPQLLSRTE